MPKMFIKYKLRQTFCDLELSNVCKYLQLNCMFWGCVLPVCSNCKCNEDVSYTRSAYYVSESPEDCAHHFSRKRLSGSFSMREGRCIFSSECTEIDRVETGLKWIVYEYSNCPDNIPTQAPTYNITQGKLALQKFFRFCGIEAVKQVLFMMYCRGFEIMEDFEMLTFLQDFLHVL